jgi:hypothetical protein
MAKLRKAARGKRRWVGVKIDTEKIDQGALLEQLASDAGRPRLAWTSDDKQLLILEVRLENYRKLIDSIGNVDYAESITSSGKIRLVKSRISQSYKSL